MLCVLLSFEKECDIIKRKDWKIGARKSESKWRMKMSIPKYDEMYQEFLNCLSDGRQHQIKEVRDYLAEKFSLSPEERKELLLSGGQPIFNNRVGWTMTYLKKAGLIQNTSRGVYSITEEGRRTLKERKTIDADYLRQFDSFREFLSGETQGRETRSSSSIEAGKTPQDTLDEAFHKINATLCDDLLSEILKRSPAFFERLVVKLLMKMGYGGFVENAGIVLGQTGDEGIDGVVREDKLGFSLIYIQAKRWDRDATVGRPEVQKFVGALAGQGATKGLFITTAKFTKEARQYAEKQHTTKIILVDGRELTNLMVEYGVGVSEEAKYVIKRIDSDFFEDDIG